MMMAKSNNMERALGRSVKSCKLLSKLNKMADQQEQAMFKKMQVSKEARTDRRSQMSWEQQGCQSSKRRQLIKMRSTFN
jgi:hypothetical protein